MTTEALMTVIKVWKMHVMTFYNELSWIKFNLRAYVFFFYLIIQFKLWVSKIEFFTKDRNVCLILR